MDEDEFFELAGAEGKEVILFGTVMETDEVEDGRDAKETAIEVEFAKLKFSTVELVLLGQDIFDVVKCSCEASLDEVSTTVA